MRGLIGGRRAHGWLLGALAGACLLMPGLVRSYGLARPLCAVLGAYLMVCVVTRGIAKWQK